MPTEKYFHFHQLSKNNENSPKEGEVIRDLLGAFRHIELVSIILRFIRPESFGILSPPVEHVLALSRGKDHVETYRHYLHNLRAIRNEYEFDTAADADMALWVLEHKCYISETKDPEIEQAFKGDEFMLRLRAKNMVAPLFKHNLSPARLANALYEPEASEPRNHMAVLMGCYALEKSVKELTDQEEVEEEAKQLAKKESKKQKPTPTVKHRIEALNAKGKLQFLSRDDRLFFKTRQTSAMTCSMGERSLGARKKCSLKSF